LGIGKIIHNCDKSWDGFNDTVISYSVKFPSSIVMIMVLKYNHPPVGDKCIFLGKLPGPRTWKKMIYWAMFVHLRLFISVCDVDIDFLEIFYLVGIRMFQHYCFGASKIVCLLCWQRFDVEHSICWHLFFHICNYTKCMKGWAIFHILFAVFQHTHTIVQRN